MTRTRLTIAALGCLSLAACGESTGDLAAPVDPIGDFQLGFSEVVAPNLQKLLISRDATEEEWIEAVDSAVEERFDRFNGGSFYHFGISVEGYSLPPPLVPGRSYVAIRVTVWDDATQSKLREEPELILNARFFESRIINSREETIRRLAEGAAREIEFWLRRQESEAGWFAVEDAAPVVAEEETAAAPEAAVEESDEEAGRTPPPATRPVARTQDAAG